MKKNNNISFDELIKNTFEGAQTPPPAGIWEGVSSQMASSSSASAISSTFVKTIAGKLIVGSIVVALTTLGLVKVLDTPDKPSKEDKSSVINEQLETIQNEKSNEMPNVTDNHLSQNSNHSSSNTDLPLNQAHRNNLEGTNANKENPIIKRDDVFNQSSIETPTTKIFNANSLSNGLSINIIDSIFCVGEELYLHAYYQPIWEEIIKQNPGATLINGNERNWIVSYPKSGKYQVVLVGLKNGVKYQVSKNIIIEEPKADFSVKHTSNGTALTARNAMSMNYKWSINGIEYKNSRESTLFIPYADFGNKPKAIIQLEVKKGKCTDSKQSEIQLPKEEKEIFIPNVFTPTVEDGKNDCFVIAIEETTFYYLIIKNRNGNIVFESKKSEECWNGAVNNIGPKCAQDAYFYQLIYQKENQEKKTISGKVQLF